MINLPLYLLVRFSLRVWLFIRHWYAGGFEAVFDRTAALLSSLDRTVALRITLRNIFEPLYQDRSFIGYTLGFIFRFLRVLFGGIFYAAIIIFAALAYLIWAIVPLFILWKIAQPF